MRLLERISKIPWTECVSEPPGCRDILRGEDGVRWCAPAAKRTQAFLRCALVLLALLGCGSSTATRSRLLEDEELEALRRSQPALVAEAEEAESAALLARENGRVEEAGDLETEARLLFDLATATEQAERFEAQARELSESVEAEAAILAEAVAERETLVASRIAREARDNALVESRRAFAIAEGDERRRLRRRSNEVSRARLTAATALAERVDLLSIATEALGGEVPRDVAARAAAIREDQDGAAAIAAARTLHQEAMARLGEARSNRAPSPERCQSLVTMAQEREFDIALIPEGLVFRDVNASRGNALSELLTSFPDGPIVLMGDAKRLKRALSRRLPAERLREVEGEESLVLVPACTH